MTDRTNKRTYSYADGAGENTTTTRVSQVTYTGAGSTTTKFYYYVQNLQGDVIALVDSANGNTVVTYTYDAWGNVLNVDGSLKTTLGVLNPFRYRGYIYDSETKLYYLQSRYYDPNLGRFLNADAFTSTGQGILGNNMFAYCGNNPICYSDPEGTFWWPAIIPIVVIPFLLTGCGNSDDDAPDGYVKENSIYHNCYSYAFGLPSAANPGMYSISDDPRDCVGGNEDKEFYTLDEIQVYVLRDMNALGINVRPINSPSEINNNEYLVAMKTSDMILPGMTCADVHFAILLDNGMWADKQGSYPSRWGQIDGYAVTWDLDPGDGYYNSDTRYFAVEKTR